MIDYIDNALRRIQTHCHELKPDDNEVKLLAIIPVINNIFLQIKSEQLHASDPETLRKIGLTMSRGLCVQLFIYAPFLAKFMGYLSFMQRLQIFIYLTIYFRLSVTHINCLTPKRKNP